MSASLKSTLQEITVFSKVLKKLNFTKYDTEISTADNCNVLHTTTSF